MHLFRPTPAAAAAALLLALTGPATAASFTWTTGAFVAGTTAPNPLTAGDVLNIQGAGAKSFTAVSFSNAGTVNWEATSGSLFFNGGAVINSGLWDAQGDAALVFFGGANSFTNSGSLRKSSGTGITQIGNSVGGFAFVNSGVVDARTGTIAFNGSQTFNPGTVFTGAGQVAVNTASTFNGAFTSSNLSLASGVQTGNAAVLNGQAQWAAGTLAGSWAIAPGATLNVQSGAGGRTIGGGSVTNNGTMAWLGSAGNGTIAFSGGSVVNNGIWDARGDAALASTGVPGSSVTNNGVFRKTGGTGTTSLTNSSGFGFTNNGTVDVQTGTIQLPNAFNNAGRLTGNGTLQSAGGITNNGTVAPGSFGAGTLALTGGGSFTQTAGGVFAVDLTSLAAFDLLTVAGGAALNGTLALNCLGACSFAIGDSITILDATGTLTGGFSAVTLAGFATGAFDVLYDLPSASVRLVVTQAVTAVPEPGSWALMAAGVGVFGFFGARRRKTVRL